MAKTTAETRNGAPDGLCRKVFPGAQIKAAPTDNYAMDLINRHAIEHRSAEDVYAFQGHVANTDWDRSDERFPKEYLDRFAETLPGKALMPGHDYSALPIGRCYDAEVRRDPNSDGHYLHAKFYMAASSPHVDAFKCGTVKDLSIGFMPDKRLCSICGQDYDGWQNQAHGDGDGDWDDDGTDHKMDGEEGGSAACWHQSGQTYDGQKCRLTYGGDTKKVEALETSGVWLGCQYGAQTMSRWPSHEQKAAHVKALAPAAGSKEKAVEDREKAAFLARQKELETDNERLKALADDGEKYRQWQKDEIRRLYKSLGREASGEAILKHLAGATAAELDAVRQEIDKEHDAAFTKSGAVSGGTSESDPERPSIQELLFGRPGRQEVRL